MSPPLVWQSRPLFVSSTFRDFQAERDHLQRVVFPELADRLRARRQHLEAIDLRWGVDTVSLADGPERELQVLKVCLQDIRRCKPFLLVLLGGRYGWVPGPAADLPADWQPVVRASREVGYDGPTEGKSVTALEIEYGVLNDRDQQVRTHFFLRTLVGLPDAARAEHDDAARAEQIEARLAHEPDEAPRAELRRSLAAARHATASLDVLKQRIRAEMPDRCHEYTVHWAEEGGRGGPGATDLEAFGRRVLDVLWQELEHASRDRLALPPADWQARERSDWEAFVADVTRGFHGREALLHGLAGWVASPGDGGRCGACLIGEPGSGKSTLLARLFQLLQGQPVLLLSHSAGLGPDSARIDRILRRWCGELAGALGEAGPYGPDDRPGSAELEAAFAGLLARAATTRRVVVLLDALDRLERSARADHLTWLPRDWPTNAVLVATALPGRRAEAFRRRPGWALEALPDLSDEDAWAIAAAVCNRYHRTLNPKVLGALVGRMRPGAPPVPAHRNPLWLKLAVEELNLLDADDFGRADRMRGEDGRPLDPGLALHRMLLQTVESFPPDVPGLYDALLVRAEKVAGAPLARAFACLVGTSRTGLRDSDLERLILAVSGEECDPLRLGILRRTFRSHLVQRGEAGGWDFFHDQARAAVERRYLSSPADRRALHTRLADHLESAAVPDDPLRVAELMYHVIGTGDGLRAARHYAALADGSPQHRAATRALADHLCLGEAELQWSLVLPAAEGLSEGEVVRLCANFAFELHDVLAPEGRWAELQQLLEGALEQWPRVVRAGGPQALRARREQAIVLARLGDLAQKQGQVEPAIAYLRQASEINRGIMQLRPDATQLELWEMLGIGPDESTPVNRDEVEIRFYALRDELVVSERLGDLLTMQGKEDQALPCYEAQANGLSALAQRFPELVEPFNLAMALCRLGNRVVKRGEVERARELGRRAVEAARRCAGHRSPQALAACWLLLGEAAAGAGEADETERCYRQAVTSGRQAVDARPDNPEAQKTLLLSLVRLADVVGEHGRTEEAESLLRERLERARLLVGAVPRDTPAQLMLAASLRELARRAGEAGDAGTALALDEEALPLLRSLAEAHWPQETGLTELMQTLHRLGQCADATGRPDQAEAYYREGTAVSRRLSERQPLEAAPLERHLLMADWLAGRARGTNPFEACAWYLSAVQDARWLVDRHPEQARQWKRLLAELLVKLGDVSLEQGHHESAHGAYREAQDIYGRLIAEPPLEADLLHALGIALERMGEMAVGQREWDLGRTIHQNVLRLRQMLAQGAPHVALFRQTLAITCQHLAQLEEGAGRTDEAEVSWRGCYQVLSGLVEQGRLRDTNLAELFEKLRGRFEPSGPERRHEQPGSCGNDFFS